jgi:hypothetical protein
MGMIEVNWNPPAKQLRSFGWICLVAFGALGAWLHYRQTLFGFEFQPDTAAMVARALWGIAAVSALLALVAPRALRPLHVLLTAISLPIGLVMSHVLMALLYYGLFTPVALIFRIMGRDALDRRFEPDAVTYWTKRKPVTDRKQYFRQF